MELLPPALEEKRRAVSRMLGRPVVVRGIRTPDAGLRGRLSVEPGRVLIEYQVAEAGYFWHIPIIEGLLDRAAADPTGEQRMVEVRESACDAGAAPLVEEGGQKGRHITLTNDVGATESIS